MSERKTFSLSVQLAVITLARLCLNTGLRMVYPFAPAFARGLQVPVAAIYQLVTIRNLAGLASPLFGPLSEKFGRRPIMVAAMLFFSLGCLLVALWPAHWFLGATLIIIALAKVIYDPAMQAYVGEQVPYRQRGRAIAITEFSWAGSLLIGAPALSLALANQGWSTPFVWLGVLGLGTAVLLWRFVPRVQVQPGMRGGNLADIGRVLRQHPVVWAAVIYMLLLTAANESLFIVYGDWMEGSFGLTLVALGFSASVVGGAEITGELLAGWSVDRFGKRPVILTTGALSALAYVFLPFTGGNLTAALIAYFALFLFFETTIVGGIPLLTEIVPVARSVVMSMVLAAGALGRALGSWLGPGLFGRFGFQANGWTAAAMTLAAIVILALWVREGHTEDS